MSVIYLIRKSTLTSIADAIRKVKGITGDIPVVELDTALATGKVTGIKPLANKNLYAIDLQILINIANEYRKQANSEDLITVSELATKILELQLTKLDTPQIHLYNDEASGPNTSAILGKAILGYAILGNSSINEGPKLDTPYIYIVDGLQLDAPTIRLEEVAEIIKLATPVIEFYEEQEIIKLAAPVIEFYEEQEIIKLTTPIIEFYEEPDGKIIDVFTVSGTGDFTIYDGTGENAEILCQHDSSTGTSNYLGLQCKTGILHIVGDEHTKRITVNPFSGDISFTSGTQTDLVYTVNSDEASFSVFAEQMTKLETPIIELEDTSLYKFVAIYTTADSSGFTVYDGVYDGTSSTEIMLKHDYNESTPQTSYSGICKTGTIHIVGDNGTTSLTITPMWGDLVMMGGTEGSRVYNVDSTDVGLSIVASNKVKLETPTIELEDQSNWKNLTIYTTTDSTDFVVYDSDGDVANSETLVMFENKGSMSTTSYPDLICKTGYIYIDAMSGVTPTITAMQGTVTATVVSNVYKLEGEDIRVRIVVPAKTVTGYNVTYKAGEIYFAGIPSYLKVNLTFADGTTASYNISSDNGTFPSDWEEQTGQSTDSMSTGNGYTWRNVVSVVIKAYAPYAPDSGPYVMVNEVNVGATYTADLTEDITIYSDGGEF